MTVRNLLNVTGIGLLMIHYFSHVFITTTLHSHSPGGAFVDV